MESFPRFSSSNNLTPQIELWNLDNSESKQESKVDMTAKEKQILEKELSSSNWESEQTLEYIIPKSQLASLEMQEALLASKLWGMYEKLMNLGKSSFYHLRHPEYEDDFISEDSE